MKKEKLKLEYIFYILMAILIGLFLYWLFHDDKGTQWNVFFRKTSDTLLITIGKRLFSTDLSDLLLAGKSSEFCRVSG